MATEKSTSPRKATSKSTSDGDTAKKAPRERASAPRASAGRRAGSSEVAAAAARQLVELTGKAAEGVTGLERTEDGWTVQVEVVEVRRIPDTTDILALYEVTVDSEGELEGYRRIRRYARGVPGED